MDLNVFRYDLAVSMESAPVPPDGVRPGQLGAIMLGRVIIGDIAATLVDLAVRRLVRIEADDEGWRLGSLVKSAPRHRLDSLLHYEEVLLDGLATERALSELASSLPRTLDKTRSAITHDAVHRGWLKHLSHDERTEQGEALATHVRAFRRDLRRLKSAGETAPLTGPLLPFVLHFGLADAGLDPLVQFAHDFAATFVVLDAWKPPEREQPDYDAWEFSNEGMPQIHGAAAALWIM
jgi:hypothetical protein